MRYVMTMSSVCLFFVCKDRGKIEGEVKGRQGKRPFVVVRFLV
jgi:hypothetical protein